MKNKTVLLFILLLIAKNVSAQENELQKEYRRKVLEYNQDVKAANENTAMRHALQESAKADFKPKLSAGGTFNYTANPIELTLNLPSQANPLTFQGQDMKYGATVSLIQPIYAGGSIRANYKMAQSESSLAKGQAEMIRSDISCEADIRYWQAAACREAVLIAKSFHKSVGKLVEVIKSRVEVEYADRNDLLMAEVKFNESEYQLTEALNNFEIARMSLNSFAGIAFDEQLAIDTSVVAINQVVSLPQELASFVNNRPEMRMAVDKLAIQHSALKLTDAQFKPQFHIGIDGSYSSPGYNFKPDLDLNYAVYAKVSIPIFEWGKRKNNRRASEYRINMAEENQSKVQDHILLEVQSSYYSYSQAVKQVCLTESSLQKASENEEMAMERYKEGAVSVIEVLNAQIYHQQTRSNYLLSKTNAQISKAKFARALGIYSSK